MRFMVLVPANKESEAGVLPPVDLLEKMTAFNQEMVKAGVLLAGEGLRPSSDGARIVFDGDKKKVVDGPFTESKELIAGYWVIQTKSLAEAVEWIKKAPFGGGISVEIRRISEAEDFAAADPSGEIIRKELELRKQSPNPNG